MMPSSEVQKGTPQERESCVTLSAAKIGQSAQPLIIAAGMDRAPLTPRSEPPRSSRASSMEFNEEIRCNFRSLQQYSSLAAFCAGGSPSRRAARLDPMNAVGGIIHV